MRVPLSWLREYVRVDAPASEIADRLSISTAEVNEVVRLGVPDEGGNLGLFRVGHVLEAAKHPNADRLQLCKVDVGEDEPARGGDEPVDVRIEGLEGCPRYVGRLFRDVKLADSPLWLKARLRAAGVRSISNVVDVTNYVMLAVGSPLHAFDYERLKSGVVIVRRARAGEELRTLDGNLRKLDPADLVIADAERAIALAGIMGGAET